MKRNGWRCIECYRHGQPEEHELKHLGSGVSVWICAGCLESGAGENPCRSDSDAETLPRFDPPMRQPGPFPSDDPLRPAAGIIYGVLLGLLAWALILGVCCYGK